MSGKQSQNSDSYKNFSKKIDISLVNSLTNSIKNTKDKLIFKIFSNTGCTPNELINLKYNDFDFSKNILKIRAETTQNHKQKTISLPRQLSLDIKEFGDERKLFLFSSKLSPQLSKRTLHRIFEKYSKSFEIKITSTKIRQIYIENSIVKKEPIEKIKQRVGLKRLNVNYYLTKKEFLEIKKPILNKRDFIILNILFESGCTLKELINLKVKNFDFENNSFLIEAETTKNKEARLPTISKKLSLEIKSFIQKNKLYLANNLFYTRQSKRITEERVFQIIKYYSSKVGFKKINPQILRYSHIAHSRIMGKSIQEISNQTGIKNLDKFHLYGFLSIKKND